jgi:hypothetical protein
LLTEKENYLRIMRGEMPEFLPKYDFFGWNVSGNPFRGKKTEEGYDIDEYGMVHKGNPESMGGVMPVPGRILLDDITRWRDVIKTPDVSSVDWETFSKKQLEDKDTENNPVIMGVGDFFMKLVNFMSFTEGLIALQEEPEECCAMMEYLGDYYVELLKKYIYWFKPDVISLADDVSAAQMPFVSVGTYRDIILPHHKRLADIALDNGLPLLMHCCGKCEMFIDSWLEIGVSAWEPAQVSNDLTAIKKKYGRKLAICGGWDNTGPVSMPETGDEEFREAVINYIDTFAPNGGFVYGVMVASGFGQEEYDHKMAIANEVYETYGRDWYRNHP